VDCVRPSLRWLHGDVSTAPFELITEPVRPQSLTTPSRYINIPWVTQAGAATVFGIQAGITIAASLIIVFLQVFGKRLRKAQGSMVFSH